MTRRTANVSTRPDETDETAGDVAGPAVPDSEGRMASAGALGARRLTLPGRIGVPSWRSAGIFIPFAVLFIVLSFASDAFLTKKNLTNILEQQSSAMIVAVAGTLVLICGGIDLSVGSTFGFAGVISAMVGLHHSVTLAVLAGLGCGLAIGLINGLISTIGRINSLITTLAMSFVVSGIGAKITNGNLELLLGRKGFANLSQSHFLTIRSIVWIAAICVVAAGIALSSTRLGRYMYAVGGNSQAARLAGLRVNQIQVIAFAVSGVAAAAGGILGASRTLAAQYSDGGTELTFTVLAGIVVGGTSILGGEGAVWRTVIGLLFIALIGNGFALLGIDPLYQQIVLGVILLLGVSVDTWTRARSRT